MFHYMSETTENWRVPPPIAREVEKVCREKDIPVETLLQILLEKWLSDGAPDPWGEHVREQGFMFATRLFTETLPLEITIKEYKNDQIRYIWVNDRFRT